MKKIPSPRIVADRLHSASVHLLRFLAQQDRASGIGRAQLSALSVLVFAGPQTMGHLAAIEQVKAPTMTRIVAGMDRLGLVTRQFDPRDGRVQRIHPTSKGEQLMQQARERRVIAFERALLDSTRDDLFVLLRAAETMEKISSFGGALSFPATGIVQEKY